MTRRISTPRRIFAAVFALSILVAALYARSVEADAGAVEVLQVRAYQGPALVASVSGFAVNAAGAVVTSAHALRRAGRFTVTAGTGRAEVVAALAWRDEDADVALLRATGIGAAPVVFAAGGLAAGRRVSTVWRAADGELLTARGALGVADIDAPGAPYQHNAMVTADGYGAPLLDECGRVVGVNRRKPGGWLGFASPRAADPAGVVFATSAPRLLALLAANGVAYQAHAGPCASAEEAARAEASAAAQTAAQARAQAEAQTAAAQAASAQAEAAEEAAAEARREAEDAQARADLSAAEKAELQVELQRAVAEKERAAGAAQRAAAQAMQQAEAAQARQVAQQRAQKNRQTLLLGGGAVGLLALLAWLVFIHRGRAARRRVAAAETKAAEAERRAEGPDPNGRPGWSFIALGDESGAETGDESAGDSAGETAHESAAESSGETVADSPADFYLSAAVLQDAEQGARVGRNPESCDVVVTSPAVSREHCRIFFADGQLMLEDLKSANGTRIGARRLEAHALAAIQAGDNITLGDIEFKIVHVA